MEIPDRFRESAQEGFFPAEEFSEWLQTDADDETREYFREVFDDTALSAEWAVMLASEGVSNDYQSWEGVTITRDDGGTWMVVIHEGGSDHTYRFDDDDVAEDLIWADLYWHLRDEGVEFDKDIVSIGGD